MDETKSTNLLTKRVIVGIDQTTVQHKGCLLYTSDAADEHIVV